MSRRRPYRRRRFGRRGDPVPLLLIPDVDATLGETLAALGRFFYRYRSELAPLALGLAMLVVGWWLHHRHPSWWPWLLTSTLIAAMGVLLVPGQWIPGWTVLDRRLERVYAAVVIAAVGGWVTAATVWGPGQPPLPTLLTVGTVVLALPWWTHHRRRAKARVERTLEGWPRVAETVGLAGSRITSALVTAWGYTVRLALAGGLTVRAVAEKIPAIESALGTRPGAIRVEPDPKRADRAVLRVVERDPHATPAPWPARTAVTSITRPVELGVWEDGSPVRVSLLHRHMLIGGVMGSGKSNLLNVILAVLSGCTDALLWGIDLKQGMELRPWAGCLATLATTPQEAVAVLRAGVVELNRRAALLAAQGRRTWNPTPDDPALVIVIDEYAELTDEAHDLADSIARRGRAVDVTLLAATQRPTQQAMGHRAVRSQMDIRVCFRVRERRDADLILGAGMLAAGWHADRLDTAGKFLISAPPQHVTPRPALAYHLSDHQVATTAARNAHSRPAVPQLPQHSDDGHQDTNPDPSSASAAGGVDPAAPGDQAPETALWQTLFRAPQHGVIIGDLVTATGRSRRWVYYRLREHHKAGRVIRTQRGGWRATPGDVS